MIDQIANDANHIARRSAAQHGAAQRGDPIRF